MSEASEQLARDGEERAARFLEQKGYRILARRARTPFGDIDLVAERGPLVVFVEVKTRRSADFGAPLEAIDRKKAESLRKSVASLSVRRRELSGRPCRLDVIGVLWPAGREPEVTHVEDALDGGSWA
jgi:putative endonuclease